MRSGGRSPAIGRRPVRSLATLLGLLVFWIGATIQAAQIPANPSDGLFVSGPWKYHFVVLQQGTPDETAIGKLSFKEKEVFGIPFARIQTELGWFQWAGYERGGPRWGWYRIDPGKKYAKWIRVRIDESKSGPFWKTVKDNQPN